MKSLLNKLGLFGIGLLAYVGFGFAQPAIAQERKEFNIETILEKSKVAEPKEEKKDSKYKLMIGGTYSRPKLKKANREIHDIEKQVRMLSLDGIKTFEDWDDVFIATIGFGIQREVELFGTKLWPGLYFSYGSGPVITRQNNVRTVLLGATMDYDFKQVYTVYHAEFFLGKHVYEGKKFIWDIAGAVSFSHFESDTKLNMRFNNIPLNRRVDATFSDDQIGFAVETGLEYKLTNRISLYFNARYDWLTYTGDAHVKDRTRSAIGSNTDRYRQRVEVDSTGVGFGLNLIINFNHITDLLPNNW